MYYKISGAILWFVLTHGAVHACDICGCAPGGAMPGIVPGFRQNKVGLSYQQSSFLLQHPAGLDGVKPAPEKELFRAINLDARIYLHPRLQLTAILPFRKLLRQGEPAYSWRNADPQLGLHFLVVNTGDSLFRKLRHTWSLGGVMELPVAREESNLPLQARSSKGASGIGLQSFYGLRLQNWGLRADVALTWFNKNLLGEKAGTRGSLQTGTYYVYRQKNLLLVPQLLLRQEYAEQDYIVDHKESLSGGYSTWISPGAGITRKNLQFHLQLDIPVWQQLSQGLVKAEPRCLLQINYLFNFKKTIKNTSL